MSSRPAAPRPEPSGAGSPGPDSRRPGQAVDADRLSILFFSATGGTRLVAELLGELVSETRPVELVDILEPGAAEKAAAADLLVLCYPTYFLEPAKPMRDFIGALPRLAPGARAYLVTTFELYTGNSLRSGGKLVEAKGARVVGSKALRAPGSDLTCVLPDRLVPWLYRFGRGFPGRLRATAGELLSLAARAGAPGRLPRFKWYTPLAWPIQRLLLDGFIEWRRRIRVIGERCTGCGLCERECPSRAWRMDGGRPRHDPEGCILCTRCIHRCPGRAVVILGFLADNKRLDARHYSGLKAEAKSGL